MLFPYEEQKFSWLKAFRDWARQSGLEVPYRICYLVRKPFIPKVKVLTHFAPFSYIAVTHPLSGYLSSIRDLDSRRCYIDEHIKFNTQNITSLLKNAVNLYILNGDKLYEQLIS